MINVYKNYLPLISVVMAAYNRGSFLQRSINSLLEQSFKEWELVVVDDGSNDNTFEIINRYLIEYQNIRYLKHSNRKLAITRNAGINASVGRYVTFLDTDDKYKPEHLQLRFDFMQSHPDVDLIHGGVEIIGNPFVKDKYDLTKDIHLDDCTIGGTFFGKRIMFEDMNGFADIPYSEDSEFCERASEKYKILKVNYPTYIYYRDTADGICNNI